MYVKLLAELGLLPDSKKDDGSTLDVDDGKISLSKNCTNLRFVLIYH